MTRDTDRSHAISRALGTELNRAQLLSVEISPELAETIANLRREFEQLSTGFPSASSKHRWRERWPSWSERLRAATTDYRNVGYHWKFDRDQAKLISDYLRSVYLLIECTRAARGLTISTRKEVEDTMILPRTALDS